MAEVKKRAGRPKFSLDKIPIKFYQYLPMYQAGNISKMELSKLAGISYPTVYKYLKVLGGK